MGKRQFTIEAGGEKFSVEGYEHRNVAVKYLMKRRRSLLMTKHPEKVETLYSKLPSQIRIAGRHVAKTYNVKWERIGTEEFAGARFVFTLEEVS